VAGADVTLIALIYLHCRCWYLGLVLRRIEAQAPLHPERIATERELYETRRRIHRLHQRLTHG